ncbi:hypothetical protein [Fundidesulfovibrio putealis]|uniref:hypothetical protein n=1 Tax=Fundidesulfovibrio putealis TaxID=270496 RepID=UPI0003F4CC1C|nr:hypothetical protein [Fundidesulfovibrio putealis]
MTFRYRYLLKLGLIVSLFCLAGFFYFKANASYSWHFIWDMDLATVLDAIVIQSGYHPDHVNHSGFGMYLLLNCLIGLFNSAGVLSAVSLEGLSQSLNPLSCVAELTDFIRMVSPAVCLASVMLLSAFFFLSFRASLMMTALALLALSTQHSFIYHSTMNRTELFSILYWALGLFSMASSYSFSSPRSRTVWILIAGCCMGLAILTKLQSFIYVLMAPAMVMLVRRLLCRPVLPFTLSPSREGLGRLAALGVFNLIFFAGTLALARFQELPPGVWSFTEKYGLTSFGLLLLLIFIASPIVLWWARIRTRHDSLPTGLARWTCIMETGFLAAYLLHFAVLTSVIAGWQYLLADLKMTFFRAPLYTPLSLAEYWSQLSRIALYAPSTLALHLLALASLLYFGRARLPKAAQLLCPVVTFAALACAVLSSRPILRDMLWFETVINVLTILYCLTLSHLRAPGARTLPAIILVCVAIGNLFMAKETGARLDARYHKYGWTPYMWQQFVFFGAQQKYKALVWERYGLTEETAKNTAGPGLIQAMRHGEVRRVAEFVFPGSFVTLRHVGVAYPGYPALAGDTSLRISRMDPPLKGGMLVDPMSGVQRLNGFLPIPPKGEVTAEWPLSPYDKDMSALTVLPRADLTVWLVAEPQTLDQVLGPDSTQQHPVVELTDGDRRLELNARRITQFSKLPVAALGKRVFFVITSQFAF